MTVARDTFPMRVGAIDVGSNAIRFLAAEFTDPTHWVELEYQRVPVRLGHDVFLTGELAEEPMAAAVESLVAFRRLIDNLGLQRYRAVATSAVRESRNGGALIQRVRQESGIRLETITGSEEVRLVWLAVRNRLAMGDSRWMIMDLGGGSLEVSLVSSTHVFRTDSHTVGTVRLLEVLGGAENEPENFRQLIEEYVSALRFPRMGPEVAGLAATGGNIEELARLAGLPKDGDGVSRMPVSLLRDWIVRLSQMSVPERVDELGLRPDRADVILPAALMYEGVARRLEMEEILVPHVGVKEGVLLDVVEDVAGPAGHEGRLDQQAFDGALALGRRFQFDENHGSHVARLSLSLFDQLQGTHQLEPGDRRILLAAALLHDIGQFISFRKHHKHSFYLIHNADLPNYSPEEIPLVALVARYHRGAEPRDDHFLYGELDRNVRTRVREMAALLRIGDALDREHLQRVSSVRPQVEGKELVLEVEGQGDLLLERWALRKKSRMFHSVFGADVRLVTADAVTGATPNGSSVQRP